MKNMPYRETSVREAVLKVLDAIEPKSMSEEQLLVEVNRAIVPAVGKAEFDDAINFLCAVKKWIRSTPGQMDDQLTEWFITRDGQNVLRKSV